VRFNYRGVGASDGRYDEGRGETQDALAVIAWAHRRWPGAALALAGFSFGALIALRAAAVEAPKFLLSVAPAVSGSDYAQIVRPDCPWLIVQGEADELVDYRDVQAFAARFVPPPELQLLPGVDHFFHGRLQDLRALLRVALA
jgi:alpha/beta superfamily hydrolase